MFGEMGNGKRGEPRVGRESGGEEAVPAPRRLAAGAENEIGEVANEALSSLGPIPEEAEGAVAGEAEEAEAGEELFSPPRLVGGASRRGRRLVKKETVGEREIRPEDRLLLLDTWKRSGLPAGDFGALVGVSKPTLYAWKRRFEEHGPAGLMDRPRGGSRGSRLSEITKRTILMMKETNPDWGCERISAMLLRGPALPASPNAVARVLKEAGYELEEEATRAHPDKQRFFERAKPNQLWQTDLFTFVLKRQNRRVHIVLFMDDHSRYVVSYGVHASSSTALVLEALRAGIASYGPPEEVLTDNGPQYVTWRGKSAFTKEMEKQGIKQVVARPRHPETLGKIERFWGTLWRECLERAVFVDLGDARQRIGHFIDHYNFQRLHQGIGNLAPADRFFGAAPEVLKTLKERVAANALELARNGMPKEPFYLTGRVGGKAFSVHAEGERAIMTDEGGERKEIDLATPRKPEECGEEASAMPAAVAPDGSPRGMPTVIVPEEGQEEPPAPGTSALDEGLARMREAFGESKGGEG